MKLDASITRTPKPRRILTIMVSTRDLARRRTSALICAGALIATFATSAMTGCSSPAHEGSAAANTTGTKGLTNGSPSANPTAPASAPAEPTITSELAIETFDSAWTRIHESDFDTTHGGVDWIAVRDELRPQAARATTQYELRTVLHEMLMRLKRSHFAIIPGDVVDPAPSKATEKKQGGTPPPASGPVAAAAGAETASTPGKDDAGEAEDDGDFTFGMTLRFVESKVVVVAVAPDSAAASTGVMPGWELRSIDGLDPARHVKDVVESSGSMGRYAANAYISGFDHGGRASHALVFVDVNGTEHPVTMQRRASPAKMVKVGSLPPMPLIFESGWIDGELLSRAGASDARIGFIRFSVWLPEVAASVDRAVDELRDADGIIIDLRGNPGGFGGMVMGVGGHFVQEPVSIGAMTTRETTIEFRLNPRRSTRDGRSVEPITAPLAVLIDPLSASTSEIFAGGLQDIGRARVFGETSAGAALPAQMYRLPNGDVLLHAFADFRVPSGAALEGGGVVPLEPRTPLRSDLTRYGDPVMIDAVRWIHNSPSPVR